MVSFDNLKHEQLVQYVEERIAGPRILRLIRKWLKAGVMEDGASKVTEVGTPRGQGSLRCSQNVYLHLRAGSLGEGLAEAGARGRHHSAVCR